MASAGNRVSGSNDVTVALQFRNALVNSIITSVLATVISVFLATLGGYAFARLTFPGRTVIFFVVIATIAALFPLLVGVVQGFKAVDRNVSELFHILAASRWQRLRKLAFPSALPYLFSALKIAAPLSVLGALIAEWVSADRGLGIMMIYALFSFDVPLAWLTILAVCFVATLAYGLVALAERIVLGGPQDPVGATGGAHG